TLGRALESLGLAEESAVAAAIASALHLEYLDREPPDVPDDVVALLPPEFCRQRKVAPLGLDGTRLRIAVADPLDDGVLQAIGFRTGRKTVAVVLTETRLERL